MSTQRQMRRDTFANLGLVVPAVGEHIYDLTNDRLGVGDGVRLGSSLSSFALMQHDLVNMSPIYAVAGGTADALTVTLNPAPTAYVDGMTLIVRTGTANTGAATLDVNGLGAEPVTKNTGVAVTAGDIQPGHVYILVYQPHLGGSFHLVGGESGGTGGSPFAVTRTVFDASGVWQRPATGNFVHVQLWGGGGSGGKGERSSFQGVGGGAGGGGAAGVEYLIPFESIHSNASVSVGAGGPAGPSTGNYSGSTGGVSSFVHDGIEPIMAYGGGGGGLGGRDSTSGAVRRGAERGYGGGGGGAFSSGETPHIPQSEGIGGEPIGTAYGGGVGGAEANQGFNRRSIFGGGGGGPAGSVSQDKRGHASVFGAGGGGGAGNETASGTGGGSVAGGHGGNGGTFSNNGHDGGAPGGGGGGASDGRPGAGGHGRVIVTVF